MPTLDNPSTIVDNPSRDIDAISGRLVAARTNAVPLSAFPGDLPDDLETAYAIQAASIARWNDEIAGWKVGLVPPAFREDLSAVRLAGPIFKSSIVFVQPGATTEMPIFTGGFAAVEAEFVFRLATTVDPVEKDYSDEELTELVAALHVGAEIASSPMADVNKLGPCCVVSDFGNNAGLLIGPSIPDWNTLPPDSLTAVVSVDDVVVGKASAGAIEDGLLEALRFLIRLSARRRISLGEGTFVSTGALTGIHDVTTDSEALVDFGSFGAFGVTFESMPPRP